MAGARALWRATGMTDDDFGKPIVAIANTFTQFVPGHVHLKDLGGLVADAIAEAGGVGREFNTIAVDDGIAMGHGGMLYSLPSRELIADAVEYMVDAHCADALVCISNCDKITPGMLLAALRLNIPTVFVSGGPMEAGKTVADRGHRARQDRPDRRDDRLLQRGGHRRAARRDRALRLPDLRLLLRHVHRQLDELPHRGDRPGPARQRLDPGHPRRAPVALRRGRPHRRRDRQALVRRRRRLGAAPRRSPPGPRSRTPSPSTWRWAAPPTRCCTCSPPPARPSWTSASPTSTRSPAGCPAWPRSRRTRPKYHMEDVHRAGGIPAILGELDRAGLLHRDVHAVHSPTLDAWLADWDIRGGSPTPEAVELFHAAPGGVRTTEPFSTANRWSTLDTDAADGCIRDLAHAYSADGGLAILHGNLAPDGCVVKTAGVPEECLTFRGPAKVFESQDDAVDRHPGQARSSPATWW